MLFKEDSNSVGENPEIENSVFLSIFQNIIVEIFTIQLKVITSR